MASACVRICISGSIALTEAESLRDSRLENITPYGRAALVRSSSCSKKASTLQGADRAIAVVYMHRLHRLHKHMSYCNVDCLKCRKNAKLLIQCTTAAKYHDHVDIISDGAIFFATRRLMGTQGVAPAFRKPSVRSSLAHGAETNLKRKDPDRQNVTRLFLRDGDSRHAGA